MRTTCGKKIQSHASLRRDQRPRRGRSGPGSRTRSGPAAHPWGSTSERTTSKPQPRQEGRVERIERVGGEGSRNPDRSASRGGGRRRRPSNSTRARSSTRSGGVGGARSVAARRARRGCSAPEGEAPARDLEAVDAAKELAGLAGEAAEALHPGSASDRRSRIALAGSAAQPFAGPAGRRRALRAAPARRDDDLAARGGGRRRVPPPG